jgi:hypothetical protein
MMACLSSGMLEERVLLSLTGTTTTSVKYVSTCVGEAGVDECGDG